MSEQASPFSSLTIATRQSALALWQANFIADKLRQHYPGLTVNLLGMTTQGDRILGQSLAKIGGKGLFVKELETALVEGRADIAVHSMKDMVAHLSDEFVIAAITEREDARDALVSNHYPSLASLPAGSMIGTSSLRRESQLRARFPELEIKGLRGNVQTRLQKLDKGEFDAIILAAAGLNRLGLAHRIQALLSPDVCLPAVGQGALGIECLASRQDLVRFLAPLNDEDTAACVKAERAMNRRLNGSCQVPIGGYCTVSEGFLRLKGLVATPDGQTILVAEANASIGATEGLGRQVADLLITEGATKILERYT
jgi:hydroxymethylbilane synthase